MAGKNKNIWKSLRKWLGMGVLAGSLMTPNEGKSDSLQIKNLGDNISTFGSNYYPKHEEGAQEGESYDGYDSDWDGFPDNPNNKWLKTYTDPYSFTLQTDSRPTNSESIFQIKLLVIDKIGDNVTSTNRLKFTFMDEDTTRHYTASIHCDPTYTPGNANFDKKVNIRDVILNDAGYVNLPGIVNCPSGTVYGTCDLNPQFNRVFSSSASGGTNNPEGNQIFDYDSSTNVVLNANNGNYVDYYVLTRTDNTGCVSVVTNDIAGQTVTSTNVSMDNIKGSNSIHAVYASIMRVVTINSAYGTPNPPVGTTNVAHGATLEARIYPTIVTNTPGVERVRLIGPEVLGNDYTPK